MQGEAKGGSECAHESTTSGILDQCARAERTGSEDLNGGENGPSRHWRVRRQATIVASGKPTPASEEAAQGKPERHAGGVTQDFRAEGKVERYRLPLAD